jgi:hypothetical protein
MSLQIDRYRKHVDHFDLTETQKSELIHTVHAILESFVDRAFGDDPTQLCITANAAKDAMIEGDMIHLGHHDGESDRLSATFNSQKGTRE